MKRTKGKIIECERGGGQWGQRLAGKCFSLRAAITVAASFRFFVNVEHLGGTQSRRTG